tara:strand:- start:921 stop:1097 length:177 start_codon:yes stop_codon:yes gene_type:complete
MGFFEKLKISLNKFFGTTDVSNKISTRYRARDNKGRYVGDNPETEEDEAWVVDGDKNT